MRVHTDIGKKAIIAGVVLGLVLGFTGSALTTGSVSEAKSKKISISKKKMTIYTKQKKQLKLKNVPKKQSGKITWKSSKKKVATVSKKGVVTAKKAGKTIITATYKKKEYTCKVTVKVGASGGDPSDIGDIPFLGSEDERVRLDYSDAFFSEASTKFNHEMAKCSLASAILSEATVVPEESGGVLSNLEILTRSFGFEGFDVNEEYKTEPTAESVGVACSFKKIDDRTVVAVFIRSMGYKAEWASNMTVGDGKDIENHKGFELARRKVSAYISEYLKNNQISEDVTFWLAGQSRGAAIANLTAAWLKEGESVTGIRTSPDKIYAYCFATPRAAYVGVGDNKKDIKTGYEFIHNLVFDRDIVCRIPPAKLGFDVYGVRESGVIGTDDEKVKDVLKTLDSDSYNSFVTAAGQDLKGMTPVLVVDKCIDDFAAMVVDRETYTREWQDTAIYMMSVLFGGGAPEGITSDPEKGSQLLELFSKGGLTLLIDHYPYVEYAYLVTAG